MAKKRTLRTIPQERTPKAEQPAREAGAALDVVPLFETVADLPNAGAIAAALIASSVSSETAAPTDTTRAPPPSRIERRVKADLFSNFVMAFSLSPSSRRRA